MSKDFDFCYTKNQILEKKTKLLKAKKETKKKKKKKKNENENENEN